MLLSVSATSGVLECSRCSTWQVKDNYRKTGTREANFVDATLAVSEINGGSPLIQRLENSKEHIRAVTSKLIDAENDEDRAKYQKIIDDYNVDIDLIMSEISYQYIKHMPRLRREAIIAIQDPYSYRRNQNPWQQ
jgi:hypothetical protein